jgi:hypothetical protein
LLLITPILFFAISENVDGALASPPPSSTIVLESKVAPRPLSPVAPGFEIGTELISSFARSSGLSIEEGNKVFADSKPISDFMVENLRNPSFGEIRASFEGGRYQVVLRIPTDGAKLVSLNLAAVVQGEVRTIRAGRSWFDTQSLMRATRESLKDEADEIEMRVNEFGEVEVLAAKSVLAGLDGRLPIGVRSVG